MVNWSERLFLVSIKFDNMVSVKVDFFFTFNIFSMSFPLYMAGMYDRNSHDNVTTDTVTKFPLHSLYITFIETNRIDTNKITVMAINETV